jgi:alpha-L-rhamnosidase
MRFAESLRPDGSVDQANLRSAWARDVYFAAGRGREVWEPCFTYHGFRYVELRGIPESAQWSITARAGYQDLAITGAFQTGNAVVQKFWENSLWSQKSNFWGLPTDCPQRDERLGWIGDAQVFWEAASFNMDTAAYTARVMDDIRRGQRENGAFPDCIPPFVPGSQLSSPGWADGGIILPNVAWRQYGATGTIDANWSAMDRYMAWILANNPDYIWAKSRGADYGDWLAVDSSPTNPGLATTPKELIGTAFWAANASMMSDMAGATGRKADAARYQDLFRSIRAAFNSAYVSADGSIGNGSQTSYILPICFGLLNGDAAREAGRRLVADIEKRGGHLSTGFLGTPYILDALANTGHEKTAVSLLLKRDYPSWGYMVDKGATSMWERWNSDTADGGMNSLNHYAFGAIGAFLFRRIAGIAPAEPGFTRVRIAPIIDARLGSAGATYASASGRIRTDWRVADGKFRLDVDLPAGVEGDVFLPGGGTAQARPGPNRYTGTLGSG